MRPVLILGAALLGAACCAAAPAAQAPVPRELRLEEFVRLACQRDLAFQQILIDELQLQYRPVLGLPAADLLLSVKGQYDFRLGTGEKDGPEASLSLSKLFVAAGTELSAEYGLAQNALVDEYRSAFTLAVSQPIAQNAFGQANRLRSKLIGLETRLAEYQITEAYEDYLASLIKLYYDWYSAWRRQQTGEISYSESRKLLQNIQEKKANKIADQSDVNKIHLQVLADRENVLAFTREYRQLGNLIRQALALAENEELRPVEPGQYRNAEMDFESEYQAFTRDSRTYRILALLEEQGSQDLAQYADELLPAARLFAGYRADGADFVFDNKGSLVFAGASVDLPLPGQQERARYEVSKIASRKTVLTTRNKRSLLAADLRNLYLAIAEQKEYLDIAEEKIKRAEAILAVEIRNYRYGRVTLNDVITATTNLEQSRYGKISHGLELNRLYVEWLRLTDQLVAPGTRPAYENGTPRP